MIFRNGMMRLVLRHYLIHGVDGRISCFLLHWLDGFGLSLYLTNGERWLINPVEYYWCKSGAGLEAFQDYLIGWMFNFFLCMGIFDRQFWFGPAHGP